MHTLTLVSHPTFPLTDAFVQVIKEVSHGNTIEWLGDNHAVDIREITNTPQLRYDISVSLASYPIDWCIQPDVSRRKTLLISDMDSTIIGQECIDELADMMGVKAQVSAITERAMQGELDFAASLTERVALLQGLPIATLTRVWEERITFNEGAKTLVRTMRANGAYTMLVSGGFTFFTQRVAEAIGFEVHHANTLDIATNETLTGYVVPPILDKDSKRHLLTAALEEKGQDPITSIAVGDGANDTEMIRAAGLGVAYYAKPFLQSQANASILHTDLTSLLYFQGFHHTELLV